MEKNGANTPSTKVFVEQETFLDAISNSGGTGTLVNFDSSPLGPINGSEFASGGLTFSSPLAPPLGQLEIAPPDFFASSNYLNIDKRPFAAGDDRSDSLTVDLAGNHNAFGFRVIDSVIPDSASESISVFSTNGDLIYKQSIDDGSLSYFGIISPYPIGSIVVEEADNDGDNVGYDDFTVGNVEPPTPIVGTPENDVLTGTNGPDILQGLAGDDILRGLAGGDSISGGSGNDLVSGGDGDDSVAGDDGNDHLLGGTGNDTIDGGAGKDCILGEAGNDNLIGGEDNDIVEGDEGDDTIQGFAGDDTLIGGAGNDDMYGQEGNDFLTGDEGDDTIQGFAGDDTLIGGAGNDDMYGQEGNDFLTGDEGDDTMQGFAGDDTLIGGAGNDDMYGQEGNDFLTGDEGDDTIQGFAGDDTLIGGAGNDDMYGQEGNDFLTGDEGDDTIQGFAGDDTLIGGAGNDDIYGQEGNDFLTGDEGNDTIQGFAGDDTLLGGAGNDSLLGGENNDILDGGEGNDALGGGAGGQDQFLIKQGDGTDTVTDFGGVGRGASPSAATIAETDTLKFEGEGLTPRNMLLNQNGDNLEITFDGVKDTKVILQDFQLENLDNLHKGTGATVNLGNILFDGQSCIKDSFDVFNAESQQSTIWNRNTVTFLNDLDNNVEGFNDSNDVINGQGGNDQVRGLSGNDLLRGGAGSDTLDGGNGDDILVGFDASAVAPLRWNLASDFRTSPNQANPSPDVYGNGGVWSFLQSKSLEHHPADYSPLGQFIPDAFGISGLEQWQDPVNWFPNEGDGLPAIGINATGVEQCPSISWPNGAIRSHPFDNQLAIVSWSSPVSAIVNIEGSFADMDANGGNGVLWSVDKGGTTLASGDINGNAQSFALSKVLVSKGDVLYFLVDPKENDFSYDSTQLDITIAASVGETDALTGGKGSDTFVLGDSNAAYYAQGGESDYAVVTDFCKGDVIQLNGKSEDYALDPTFTIGDAKGTGIFLKGTPETNVSATVPGTSDPWLAGMPDGSTASVSDVAPDQSPIQVVEFDPITQSTLTFSATGEVSNGVGYPLAGPDGNGEALVFHLDGAEMGAGAENGISDIRAPLNALVGVFLGPEQPNLTPAPDGFDFSSPSSQNYLSLSPLLKQVFFVGDGITDAGEHQQVIVPNGATQVLLGTMDGISWNDNSGVFSVQVTGLGEADELIGFVEGSATLDLSSSDFYFV